VLGLPASQEEDRREADLMHLAQLSGLIASYQHAYGVADGNLKRLCGFVKHFLGAVDDRRVAPAAQVGAVQIMTVHRAKGLEWPVVFVAERRKCPTGRGPQPQWMVPENLFEADRYWNNPEEERQILYVALTKYVQNGSEALMKRLPVTLTETEVEALRQALATTSTTRLRNRVIVEAILGAGLRVSEVCALKGADVDLTEGTIRVNLGKGKKDRVVPVDNETPGLASGLGRTP